MSTADQYRRIAAELDARAAKESNSRLASEWAHLARCYRRLAEQADTNSFADVWLEIGAKPKFEGDGA